ncbi:DUF3558 domain-containing protein [Nocardia terpenica]|uniref:DUF3558 domain-containing protein n=1 Tax=Nocardia terpenica TaxID=455432 RepID=UPI0018940B31|nr:DUF3558 domain-containing protein [Nocardia terpenica]MBF6063723.1 DUF3558 domain-containing protein [Nocardia terpenica]MBF6107099.1 DUF3558 domain-containing protein [Nocardia terpenica]MBF6114272.1 DUF3558 domain-containing protein [Nocardia terpenica]MBF6121641.1 DUF3558 domain-containing protein [Nocardia terpenica]MBF6154056.1 DUF3558 domain-containing protein [Nocardia terpenica]
MARRAAGVALAVGVVSVSLTGCGSSSPGTATPTTTDKQAATAALWDPCTQIGSDTLQQLGVDQSSKDSGIGGVPQPGWKDCSWSYPPEHDQSVTIWSSIYTIDDYKQKADNTDFMPITAAGRSGWKYHRVSDKNNEKCDLVFPAQSSVGAYEISFYNLEPGLTASPCDRAMSVANIVVPLFPR